MHEKSAAGLLYPFDTRSVNLKLSGELGAGDLRVDIRCDAVTEDVPSCGVLWAKASRSSRVKWLQIRCVWGRILSTMIAGLAFRS